MLKKTGMRVKVGFITDVKIDHEFYGLKLVGIDSVERSCVCYEYEKTYSGKIPERIKGLLASSIVLSLTSQNIKTYLP